MTHDVHVIVIIWIMSLLWLVGRDLVPLVDEAMFILTESVGIVVPTGDGQITFQGLSAPRWCPKVDMLSLIYAMHLITHAFHENCFYAIHLDDSASNMSYIPKTFNVPTGACSEEKDVAS